MPTSFRQIRVACFVPLFLCACTFSALAESKPATPPPVPKAERNLGPTIEQFTKIRWPRAASLSADGALYFIHDPDGVRQLYRQGPSENTASAKKLTSFVDGISGYSISDDGKWIVLTAATGGSEQTAIHLMDAATGRMEQLYGNPNMVYESPVWRRDSKAFAFRANDESSADFFIYIHDISAKSKKKVYGEKGSNAPADFNADGSKLVVSKYTSASYSQLFEISLAGTETREITPKGEQWSFDAVGYDVADRNFLVNSNYKGDLKSLFSIDLQTGTMTPRLSELTGKEIDFAGLTDDRKTIAIGINEDGYRTLQLRNSGDFSSAPTPAMGKGIVGNIDFRGGQMLYALDNANTPGIVHVWDMKDGGKPGKALTQADTQGIDVSKFPLPELVHYPSFDGTKIPAFLYLPPKYQVGDRIPFLIQYHGGPEAQYRPAFDRTFQYFLSRGYGVLAPNVRGSSGYGKLYLEADDYKNREKSVKDGVYAAKFLIEKGYSEKRRIAAWGGSYGGFMTMAVITEAPELFGAACNIVGIVNFETFLKQTKDYRRALREVEYGPLSDPEFLKSISPIHKVDRIDMPLMIAHGLNDPRVPVGEAMQIAVALKKRGRPVVELYFPDEGHGFAKEENRLLFNRELDKFFGNYLRASSSDE